MTLPARTHLDIDARLRAIAATPLFNAWPEAALRRLARASRVSTHRPGSLVIESARRCIALTLVVEGAVQASVTAAGGRRITFKVGSSGGVYGLLPMFDRREMASDLIAVDRVAALVIPYAAIRAELARAPELWESVAVDAATRARGYTDQMKRFLFDEPRVRMAASLVSLAHGSARCEDGTVVIGVHLPQERLAELLGISRQWATGLVREMCRSGLIRWRYGRVTVLDLEGLKAIARSSVNVS
ncbi:MAG: Crp/Fnr family transcriptional regulator [Burkholderiales bacterium]